VIRAAIWLVALLCCAIPAAAEPAAPAESASGGGDQAELNLVVGENRTISAAGVRNYSEGETGIVDTKLTTDRSRFVVVGRRAGTTSLLLIRQDGTQTTWIINVYRRSPDRVREEVQQLLQGSPGCRIRQVGTRLFIEGSAGSAAELARIERVAALYPGQVESLVVTGPAPDQHQINLRIDFFFVQYDKTSGYGVGIDWPARFGGGSVQTDLGYDFVRRTTTLATASVVEQPLPALDLAAYQGWAKVLKQSTVITGNGSQASFESGGEQNFAVTAAQSASIQSIEYGISVTVLPRLDLGTGELEIGIKADVANLAPAASSSALPGRATAKLDTTVRMRLGQSLVLSGLRASARRATSGGLPILSEIPLLGILFGSQRTEEEAVESAVFVIPSAVESVPRPALELVQSALREFEGFSGDLDTVEPYPATAPRWSEAR
jgi:pilus assembly protein CpaC